MSRWLLPALALLASASVARADERYDHHGALGLTVASGIDAVTVATTTASGEAGVRVPIELGGTLSVTDHLEARLAGRLSPGIPPLTRLGGALFGGVRSSFGYEQWKTFFDLELAVHVAPFFAIGARAAFGVQYDFSPIAGVYAQIGGQLAGSNLLRLSFDAMLGVQFRTYLFE